MNILLKNIKELLLKIIDNIDAGNSNLTEEEEFEVLEALKTFTNKEKRLSKYSACGYLNISRATFDNYIKEGKLPKGKHDIGFKELSWSKKDLDEFLIKYRNNKKYGTNNRKNSKI